MSSVGPASGGAYQVPGSIAGTQRNAAETDRARAEQAARKFQVDRRHLAVRETEELPDSGLSADRDVDGRLPYSLPQPQEESPRADSESAETTPRCADALDERGRLLDLDA